MLLGSEALAQTDWRRLVHAYGRASDAPDHLRALLGQDETARKATMSYLWSAIIHQGTPWLATGPVVRVIAGWLTDGTIEPRDALRAPLLDFLNEVIEAPRNSGVDLAQCEAWIAALDLDALLERDDLPDDDLNDILYGQEATMSAAFGRSLLGCFDCVPIVLDCFMADLDSQDPATRRVASRGAAAAVAMSGGPTDVAALTDHLTELAKMAESSDERAAHVMAIGDLGGNPEAFLHDAAPGVRYCASLAAALASSEPAQGELIRAIEQSASMDDWFEDPPSQFATWPRFRGIARLLERVPHFDRLVRAAVAVVPLVNSSTIDFDVAPFLRAAFPAGDGRIASEAQRLYLRALIARPDLWNPSFGNASTAFKTAGLPYDAAACAALLR